ncbi:unnamed protein product [Caenorhabditis bovis]|uniref:Uncharacterized protein n=1 Tax=Caenorhabditis bovis TaxID=2654633 RepID=A0A8S1EMR6_9PELO|nr:unnamed protein product [Caenorhabditis bovis]
MTRVPYTLLGILLIASVAAGLCRDTEACIERVKEVVAAPRRVKTYHSAYLRNLNIFPRITYRASPGHYRACEHDYFSGNTSAVEADPDMEPVEPFRIRKRPEITWSELQFDDQYTVLFTDVGYGTLNYLAVDFPKNTKILKDYEPTDNYRPWPNPLVVLVFRKGRKPIETPNDEDFDLTEFMLKHELEDDLVGLSLIVAGNDPFAIEKQRIKGNVDYCHSLLKKKLAIPQKHSILSRLPLDELDAWLSISYEQSALNSNVCCQKIRLSKSTIFLDPLGDLTISALSTLSPPSVSSLRTSSAIHTNYVNYHRHTRNFVELSDEKFTLLVVDGAHGHLHWMIVDISAASLNAANPTGTTKAAYVPLTPKKPSTCHQYIFVLLSQAVSLQALDPFCNTHCEERKKFKLELFKQQHNLKLSALSMVSSCYDLPYAYHILKKELEANRTMTAKSPEKSKKHHFHSQKSTEICAAFHVSPHHKCPVSATHKFFSVFLPIIVIIVSKLL